MSEANSSKKARRESGCQPTTASLDEWSSARLANVYGLNHRKAGGNPEAEHACVNGASNHQMLTLRLSGRHMASPLLTPNAS